MTNVRVSTVLVGVALASFLSGLVLVRINNMVGNDDTLAAVFLLAVCPITAMAGFISSGVILFRDRRVLRWVELIISLALFVVLSRSH